MWRPTAAKAAMIRDATQSEGLSLALERAASDPLNSSPLSLCNRFRPLIFV